MFLHTDAFTRTLLHTDTFTHRHFYTQTFLHTGAAFTHKRFDTQKLLHIDAFTHRHFYTQTLLHTDAFTRRRFYTQKLLHTNAFTHRRFYIQTLLRRNTFTHRRFYTQTVLHTSAFTHNHLYTQTLLHRGRPMYSQRSHRCRGHLSNPTGWCGEVLFPCDSKQASINMSWGLCALGPPNQGGLQSPEKKYERADLAGGERFWAGTHTVLQYDIRLFFLGLGTWLLTVTGIETLILTLIHPSLYINTHTSISISYCYSYLNIKYIDLSLCGSSLPIHVIHPIPGPWLHANLAAQTNNYMRKRNRQLYSSSMESQPVLLDARRCTVVRQDALWWNWMSQAKMRASASLRQFWLTHADALHFQIQLTSVATAVDAYR